MSKFCDFKKTINKKAVISYGLQYNMAWEKYKDILQEAKGTDYEDGFEISMTDLGLTAKSGYGNYIFAGQF